MHKLFYCLSDRFHECETRVFLQKLPCVSLSLSTSLRIIVSYNKIHILSEVHHFSSVTRRKVFAGNVKMINSKGLNWKNGMTRCLFLFVSNAAIDPRPFL